MELVIASMESKSLTQVEKEIKKSAENIKVNGAKLAIYTSILTEEMESKKEASARIEELTGLGRSTISQLRSAGDKMRNLEILTDMEYSKVYLLAKVDDDVIMEDYETGDFKTDMTQKEVKEYIASKIEAALPLPEIIEAEEAEAEAEAEAEEAEGYREINENLQTLLGAYVWGLDEEGDRMCVQEILRKMSDYYGRKEWDL